MRSPKNLKAITRSTIMAVSATLLTILIGGQSIGASFVDGRARALSMICGQSFHSVKGMTVPIS